MVAKPLKSPGKTSIWYQFSMQNPLLGLLLNFTPPLKSSTGGREQIPPLHYVILVSMRLNDCCYSYLV